MLNKKMPYTIFVEVLKVLPLNGL